MKRKKSTHSLYKDLDDVVTSCEAHCSCREGQDSLHWTPMITAHDDTVTAQIPESHRVIVGARQDELLV